MLSFHTRVGLVKDLPEGMTISYGRTRRLKRNSRIAILTAGYADGLSTGLSNRGKVLIHGHRCPVVGRVTMDQTMVDVTDLPQCPRAGDTATFIGHEGKEQVSATEFASDSGQIEWEVFCSLTARTTRIYSADSAL